jgi:hypothetical protein
MFKFSVPTKPQIISGVERVVAVFVIAAFGAWQVVPNKFSVAAAHAAVLAGITAVYSVVKAFATTL